ncbi:MAG TPA: S26 family signal peptidase [Gemmatimonadales bacterium]|nr:S26 family signal peptidase [Gemmatimonadales bacterium]
MDLAVKTLRPFVVIGTAAVSVLAVRLAWAAWGPSLLINTTVSEPVGVYWVKHRTSAEYTRGMRVTFPVALAYQGLVVERGWLAPGIPLIKHIGALAGDCVCIGEDHAAINGAAVGPVFTIDSAGRPLPTLRGCLTVPSGYFLPLSTTIPNSFDGRYIGVQPLSAILGEAIPVWIF